MVEKQKLLKITHTTGMPSSTAVVTAPATDRNPPSPTRHDDRTIRRRDLRADRRRRRKSHRRQPAAGDERLRQRRHQLLARAVLVPADVGHEHRVFRRHARDLVQQARRMNRLAGVALLRRELPLPRRLPRLRDRRRAPRSGAVRPCGARRRDRGVSPSRRRPGRRRPDRSCRSPAGRCRSGSARVGGNREGVVRVPRAAVRLAEGRADRENDVGAAASDSFATRVPQMPVMPTDSA